LLRIVRAKEGCAKSSLSIPVLNIHKNHRKMVNVNARLPFNLHHKKLSITTSMDRPTFYDSSSNSRSASTSGSQALLSSTPRSHSGMQVKAHVGGPLTVVPSNTSLVDLVTDPNGTGSRSSSMASRDTSASTQRNGSETSKVAAALRSPVINAHLVRRIGAGIPVALGGADVGARRGRAKTKKESSGDSGGSPIARLIEGASEQQNLSTSLTSTVAGSPTTPIVGHITNHPTLSISPASTTASTSATLDFKLKDTGPLSVSWGD